MFPHLFFLTKDMFILWTFQVALVVKSPPVNAGGIRDTVQSLGGKDPLEECVADHSNIFAWRIPWTEEPGELQSIASQIRVRDN